MGHTQKEKSVRLSLFIVDAINIGHGNYFMRFVEYFMGLRDAFRIPPDPWSGGGD
jgi:hypothetical protein